VWYSYSSLYFFQGKNKIQERDSIQPISKWPTQFKPVRLKNDGDLQENGNNAAVTAFLAQAAAMLQQQQQGLKK